MAEEERQEKSCCPNVLGEKNGLSDGCGDLQVLICQDRDGCLQRQPQQECAEEPEDKPPFPRWSRLHCRGVSHSGTGSQLSLSSKRCTGVSRPSIAIPGPHTAASSPENLVSRRPSRDRGIGPQRREERGPNTRFGGLGVSARSNTVEPRHPRGTTHSQCYCPLSDRRRSHR